MQNRLAMIQAARNPLRKAAQPLLGALAKIPATQFNGRVEVETFRQVLQNEVITFKKLCIEANINRVHATLVSYSLCTALDEAANSTKWGGGTTPGEIGSWASNMLASTFHSDTEGGKKVFSFISWMASKPHQYADVLEVLYHILSLGFQGQYSTIDNGSRKVEEFRKDMYPLFMDGRPPVPLALSPNWRGERAGRMAPLYSIPVWVTAGVLGLVLLAVFSWYKYRLTTMTNQIEADLRAISNMMSQPERPTNADMTTINAK